MYGLTWLFKELWICLKLYAIVNLAAIFMAVIVHMHIWVPKYISPYISNEIKILLIVFGVCSFYFILGGSRWIDIPGGMGWYLVYLSMSFILMMFGMYYVYVYFFPNIAHWFILVSLIVILIMPLERALKKIRPKFTKGQLVFGRNKLAIGQVYSVYIWDPIFYVCQTKEQDIDVVKELNSDESVTPQIQHRLKSKNNFAQELERNGFVLDYPAQHKKIWNIEEKDMEKDILRYVPRRYAQPK